MTVNATKLSKVAFRIHGVKLEKKAMSLSLNNFILSYRVISYARIIAVEDMYIYIYPLFYIFIYIIDNGGRVLVVK